MNRQGLRVVCDTCHNQVEALTEDIRVSVIVDRLDQVIGTRWHPSNNPYVTITVPCPICQSRKVTIHRDSGVASACINLGTRFMFLEREPMPESLGLTIDDEIELNCMNGKQFNERIREFFESA